MIKTNIWVVFSFYLIYALISQVLFLMTSGGWVALVHYLGIAGTFYVVSLVLLFLSATFRTVKHRTIVKFKGGFFLRIMAMQAFVVLFNYKACGDSVCYESFLPTLLQDTSIPILFEPPFVLVLFALIAYFILLWLFLLDVG
jgi:hypothetical protein